MSASNAIIKNPERIICKIYCKNFICPKCTFGQNMQKCGWWCNCVAFHNNFKPQYNVCEINWKQQSANGWAYQCWQCCLHYQQQQQNIPQTVSVISTPLITGNFAKEAITAKTRTEISRDFSPPIFETASSDLAKKNQPQQKTSKSETQSPQIVAKKFTPSENIPEKIKSALKTELNKLSQEKDVSTWLKNIEKNVGVVVSLIGYNSGRRLWKRTEFGDTPELACATYKKNNGIIVFPSPNVRNFHITRISDWYEIKGNGSNYTINSLAFATSENDAEFSVDVSRKGVLTLY